MHLTRQTRSKTTVTLNRDETNNLLTALLTSHLGDDYLIDLTDDELEIELHTTTNQVHTISVHNLAHFGVIHTRTQDANIEPAPSSEPTE